jgi:hypothetical protein
VDGRVHSLYSLPRPPLIDEALGAQGQMGLPSEREVMLLIERLCVRLGFCLPSLDQQALATEPPPGPTEFTDAVFKAEGMEVGTYPLALYRQVRALVAAAYHEAGHDGA